MKHTTLSLTLLSALIIYGHSSCIKDEPLNREADIEDIIVEDNTFIDRSIAEDNTIELVLSGSAILSEIKPTITLSPGATVEPASGTTVDFSDGKQVVYTVTSQDKQYTKQYTVRVSEIKSLKYDFDGWSMAGTEKYPFPILTDPAWSNANTGVVLAIMMKAIDPDRYPTDKGVGEDVVKGAHSASLQTIEGGTILGKYYAIFAGNLLRGDFSANMSNPLKSLKLGRNHPKELGKPALFKGYYKYTPGKVMTDKNGNEMVGKTDKFSMYAAIFRVTKGAEPKNEYLDGETILTSERVVARAEWDPTSTKMVERAAVNGFTEFYIPFEYTGTLNYDEYDYRLTIVCSSSKDGNLYEGAVGSTLVVDELEITCDPIND